MTVSIVSIFRDEAKFLKEWIEFHLMVGVDTFHLVNNNSCDDYSDVLDYYIKNKIVFLYDLDVETIKNNPGRHNEEIIVHHWIDKLNKIVKSSNDDWMIHVSTDEFLYPTEVENIKDVLLGYNSNIGEISVNWTLFGHNNITLTDGDILIENLTKCADIDHIENYHVKPIFKPDAIITIPSVHFTRLKNGYIKIDAMGNPSNFKTPYEVRERVFTPLHINHYRLRDLSWVDEKIKIYELWGRNDLQKIKDNYNDIENRIILKFKTKLKNRLNNQQL
jgi:hypothetical protein